MLAALTLSWIPSAGAASQLSTTSYQPFAHGNGVDSDVSVSSDGRFVAFESTSSNLVPNDTNGSLPDVFIYDVETGQLQLVAPGSEQGNRQPKISGNGRFLVFTSRSQSLPDPVGGFDTVYLYDLQTKELAHLLEGSNETSNEPDVSNDGQIVVFRSRSNSLLVGEDRPLGESNGSPEGLAFWLDRSTGEYNTLPAVYQASYEEAFDPRVSGDGRFASFWWPVRAAGLAWFVDLASDRELVEFRQNENDEFVSDIRISDDSSALAYFASGSEDPQYDGQAAYVVVDRVAGKKTYLAGIDGGADDAVFAGPESRYMFFASQPLGGTRSIKVLDRHRMRYGPVGVGTDGLSDPDTSLAGSYDVSSDGRFLAYIGTNGRLSVRFVGLPAPSDALACGDPGIDPATDRGVFFWNRCSNPNQWVIQVVGGGVRSRSNVAGSINGPISSFSSSNLEPDDSVSLSGSSLAFKATVFNVGVDVVQVTLDGEGCLGISDLTPGLEVFFGLHRSLVPRDSVSTRTGLGCGVPIDSDGDFLSDSDEAMLFGTSPVFADSDGGGVSDLDELLNGTNPSVRRDDGNVLCGDPGIDPRIDRGIFVWKLCAQRPEDQRVEVRVVSGGTSFQTYEGRLANSGPLPAAPFALEARDELIFPATQRQVLFSLGVGSGGVDGFSFPAQALADSCLSLGAQGAFERDRQGSPVYLGGDRLQKRGPIDLLTGGDCRVPRIDCGAPDISASSPPGVYFHRNCSGRFVDDSSVVTVYNGGQPFSVYRGAAIGFGGGPYNNLAIGLEARDSLLPYESDFIFTPGFPSNDLFEFFVSGRGSDGFQTELPVSLPICVNFDLPPTAAGVFWGASATQVSTRVDLRSGQACTP